MTLNEMKYELLEVLRGEIGSDEEIDGREVESWIHTQRSLWISNKISNGSAMTPFVQNLGCIDVEFVDASLCCDVSTGCMVLKTEQKLPKFLENKGEMLIKRVGPPAITVGSYDKINPSRVDSVGYGKFNSNGIFWFLNDDDHIYLIQRNPTTAFKLLKKINVTGVLDNPLDAKDYNTCSGLSCYDENSDYPITRKLWAYMKGEIIKNDFRFLINSSSDTINDNQHKIKSNVFSQGQQ